MSKKKNFYKFRIISYWDLRSINPLTSPEEGVTVFTSPYLSAGAPALGEAKGLKKEINLDAYFENSLKLDKADKEHIYLIKGLCKVNLNENFTELMKKRILLYANLHNFLNPFFNAIISPKDESLLFLVTYSLNSLIAFW